MLQQGISLPKGTRMHIYIGFDGGGTACRAQAEFGDGRRTSIMTGGAANVFSDFPAALREITGLLDTVLAQAKSLAQGIPLAAPKIVMGLAGVSESGAQARLRAALPYTDLTILGDIDSSLSGALKDQAGIVMAVGTGSVLARQRAGAMLRLGGYGFMLGDEGSGAWIGREALRHALHAHDRIGTGGPLTDEIWDQFGTVAQIIGFAGRARPSDYAALAPMVLRHDQQGCPVAGAILDQGCAYLLRAMTRLQDGISDLPVAPLGGLGPALLDRIRHQGGAQLNASTPKGTALDGALWRARHLAVEKDQP